MNTNGRSPFADKKKVTIIGTSSLAAIILAVFVCIQFNNKDINTSDFTANLNTAIVTSINEITTEEIITTEEEVIEEVSEDSDGVNEQDALDAKLPTEAVVEMHKYDLGAEKWIPYTVKNEQAKGAVYAEEQKIIEEERRQRKEAEYAAYLASQQTYYYDDSNDYYEESAPVEVSEDVGGSSDHDGMTYYGGKTLTAYEWTGNPCADGNYPQVGYTCASNDPNLWGHDIYIEGLGTYHVHHTGGMANSVIDIYMGDVESCYQFGVGYGEVYIID